MRQPLLAFLVVALITFSQPGTAPTVARADALPPTIQTFTSGLRDVYALAYDGSQYLYISRRIGTGSVVRCAPPSNVMQPVVGGLADPIGLALDVFGNLYIADYNYGAAGGSVLKVTPGGAATVFANLPNPTALAFDTNGDLFVGIWTGKIYRITPAGVSSLYADLQTYAYPGVHPLNNRIRSLVVGTDGRIYAGLSWGAIFTVTPQPGGPVIAYLNRPSTDGVGMVQSDGPDRAFYFSSYTNDEIIQFDETGATSLYAGKLAVSGFINGPLLDARFNAPAGLETIRGQLYIADYLNSAIRYVIPPPVNTKQTTWGRVKSLYR